MGVLTVIGLLKTKNLNDSENGERSWWAALGEQYLHAWISGVRKFVPEPKRIVVMTDSPSLVPAEIDCVPLLTDAPAYWSKLQMFAEEVSSGRCLYIDLDNVLCGPLDELCALSLWPVVPSPLVMLDDRNVPKLPNGSVILFNAEECRDLWTVYQRDRERIEREYVRRGEDYSRAYDQAYIADWHKATYGDSVPFFQNRIYLPDYCLNMRAELPKAEDWSGVRLLYGCGQAAKPHRVQHPLIQEHWAA